MNDGGPSGCARTARQTACRVGASAESRAAAYLTGRRYSIAARRFKSAVSEVDIVARRGPELVFVEVKARQRLDDAAPSLTPRLGRLPARLFTSCATTARPDRHRRRAPPRSWR